MAVLTTSVRADDERYLANREGLLALLADARGAGRPRPRRRRGALPRASPRQGTAHRSRAHRAAGRSGQRVPRAVDARGVGHRVPRRGEPRHRDRRRVGRRVRGDGVATRRSAAARSTPTRCARTSVPSRSPASTGCRWSTSSSRAAPTCRPRASCSCPAGRIFHDLTELSGARHPDGRARLRQLDGGRGVRAGDVRLRRHGRPARQGVPRRPAARQDGDGRGVRRRVARRCGDALAGLGAVRLLRPRRARRAADRTRDRRLDSTGASSVRARRAAADEPLFDAEELLGHRPGRPARAVRPPRGDRPGRRRLTVRRVQAHLRHEPRHGLGVHPRLPGGRARQRPGRALHGGGEEGDRVHHAREPDRHAARVPAEHDGLHGRPRLRAGRDHQGRREDDQRRHQLDGPAPHGDHGRELRGGQLRHVRPRVRAAVPLRLAELEDGGDGSAAARRRAVDRGAPERRGRGPDVRRGGRRRAARRPWRPRSSARATPSSTPARLYDDGIIDPRDTRTVLGIALSAVHSNVVEGRRGYGVFRM